MGVGGYITMAGHLEYYGGGSNGGGMIQSNGCGGNQGLEDGIHNMTMPPGRPLSVCSVNSCNTGAGSNPSLRNSNGNYSSSGGYPTEEYMDDELLMSLSVRELNKRLHGRPREEVSDIWYV